MKEASWSTMPAWPRSMSSEIHRRKQLFTEQLKKYQKSDRPQGRRCNRASGKLEGRPVSVAVMEFNFLGGSMGSVMGEKITRAIERATKARRIPVIIFSASGGARMQEGMFSLMQMAKTSGALARHAEARLPFISVLTHPTMGGVTASFATLGDLNIAEPKAMIGFAGARVLQGTTRQDLPEGFPDRRIPSRTGLDRPDHSRGRSFARAIQVAQLHGVAQERQGQRRRP